MTFKRRRSGDDHAERSGDLPAGPPVSTAAPAALDVQAIREHFTFPRLGRIVTNNAASTQPPDELLALYQSLAPGYENVHRGQSSASAAMTALFEESYDTIARFIGAPGRASIALYRNTTEAINAVMYALLSEFRNGDNVVTTTMEHNSNYVPWYAMCREILPRFGRRVHYRLARFDPVTGELDLDHLASLIDARTKLVCCTGASNFLGTRNPLRTIRALANASGYRQPNGERRSHLLVDGAQLVPGSFTDVQDLDVEYLSFSFHKMLAPFGVGVLYAKQHLLESSLPFLYGGDMIAEGRVFPDLVEYNDLPWKYSAGTPNVLGAIVSAQALRLLLDLAISPGKPVYFQTAEPIERGAVHAAMDSVSAWNRRLTARALEGLRSIPGITIYGPQDPSRRTSLVSFNLAGHDPVGVAEALNRAGVESRAGCHCATLAHHKLRLDPPASCRLSFYLYNTLDDVDRAVDAVAAVASRRHHLHTISMPSAHARHSS
jgi:cysteine desulfurase / selenocysteine lyase